MLDITLCMPDSTCRPARTVGLGEEVGQELELFFVTLRAVLGGH